ncbi:hypothetical protein [Allosphingosinicella humi]
MNTIDDAIARLASAPVDPRLAASETEWLAEIVAAGRPTRNSGLVGSGVFAAMAALAIGIAGADLPRAADGPRVALSPFGPSAPLAPATLLSE